MTPKWAQAVPSYYGLFPYLGISMKEHIFPKVFVGSKARLKVACTNSLDGPIV